MNRTIIAGVVGVVGVVSFFAGRRYDDYKAQQARKTEMSVFEDRINVLTVKLSQRGDSDFINELRADLALVVKTVEYYVGAGIGSFYKDVFVDLERLEEALKDATA